jgi:hypothetical protein
VSCDWQFFDETECAIYFELKKQSRYTRLMELLEGDPREVWEVAVRLFDDGWDGEIPDLVLAARLLAGDQ